MTIYRARIASVTQFYTEIHSNILPNSNHRSKQRMCVCVCGHHSVHVKWENKWCLSVCSISFIFTTHSHSLNNSADLFQPHCKVHQHSTRSTRSNFRPSFSPLGTPLMHNIYLLPNVWLIYRIFKHIYTILIWLLSISIYDGDKVTRNSDSMVSSAHDTKNTHQE